ncbi:MAG: DMT family transporter [Pseudomonadota bacterium]|nr:DMT family transporter [Pseudomonadota bacterium]
MISERSTLLRVAPFVFILAWSSGFPITRWGLEYAEPFTILWIRSAAVVAVVGAYTLAIRVPWPGGKELAHIAVVGVTLQCLYLGSMFMALENNVSQGVAALIAGMQPLLTAAVVGIALGEQINRIQWIGFALGFFGLFVVLSERLGIGAATTTGFIFSAVTPLFITAASLYQKKFCANSDLRIVMIVQQTAAGICNFLIAMAVETGEIGWSLDIVFVWAWLVFVLTIGATNLYYLMLRYGKAARVSSLFYLTPPTTMLLGWITYGETMGFAALIGCALSVTGVFLVTRSPRNLA